MIDFIRVFQLLNNLQMGNDWYLYLIRTRSGALYTGITTDVTRRLNEHAAGGRLTARSLRAKGPLQLVYSTCIGERSLALRLEYAIKRLPRSKKEILVASAPDRSNLLQLLDSKD